jgi:ABC-type uncharacterized transport system permease subunit
MPAGLSVFCFAASYSVALVLELVGLWMRFGWHRLVMLLFATAGLIAHTWYLGRRAAALPDTPLATPFDWCLLAAWSLAIIYLAAVFSSPKTAIGLFVLPLSLGLIGVAQLASRAPFDVQQTSRFWSFLHGTVIMLGTITVCVGFLAGLMYLIQSHRLKRKRPPLIGFQLPSLEWLERINSRSLGVSAVFMAVGFFSGVLLGRMKHRDVSDYIPWTDPVVLSLAAMLGWLVVAEVFRLVYPPARRGRKVAYLTLAAFLFLVFTLASIVMLDSVHGSAQESVGGPRILPIRIPQWPTVGGNVG